MKICKEVVEVSGEGLEGLLGQNVELFGFVYIYAGKLVGVNEKTVKLANPHIVYETGSHTEASYKDAQPLGREYHYVQIAGIESFGATKKLK